MQFDNSVNLGNIITAAIFLITLLSMHKKNIERIARIENKVNLMWSVFKRRFHVSDDEELEQE